MFRSDAQGHLSSNLLENINRINIDMVLEIQKDLDPYDMTSLVFLLYEIPDTALQQLAVYEKVSKDIRNDSMNLLYHWASYAKTRPTWKYELLEALCICRLYNVIRKLGFIVSTVKDHYHPENISFSIHIKPLKKILYRICERVTSETMIKLKKTLLTYNIDTTQYESCELIFLELMCQKFIVEHNVSKQGKVDFGSLAEILEHFPSLSSFVVYLNELESKLNYTDKKLDCDLSDNQVWTSTKNNVCDKSDFDDVYEHFDKLNLEDIQHDLTTDKRQSYKDSYTILNPERVGVCCIINQEEFYPTKESITNKVHAKLTTRHGSTKDEIAFQKTMLSFKFEVVVYKNLNSKEFFHNLKHVLRHIVRKDDSVFMLCILSHGVRGHIYAADSVKIKVEDIQQLLDSDLAAALHGKPKVLILQACQVDDDPPPLQGLVADGPSRFFLRKSDFLIYWATAPEYEAFRQESKGSLFIQYLCIVMRKKAHEDHIYDIFTKVTDIVTKICSQVKKLQVPIFESTLRKKLYLNKT